MYRAIISSGGFDLFNTFKAFHDAVEFCQHAGGDAVILNMDTGERINPARYYKERNWAEYLSGDVYNRLCDELDRYIDFAEDIFESLEEEEDACAL